jgi:hypothetical protein
MQATTATATAVQRTHGLIVGSRCGVIRALSDRELPGATITGAGGCASLDVTGVNAIAGRAARNSGSVLRRPSSSS